MTGTIVEFSHINSPKQRSLALDKSTRDAMADLWRLRWPSNTAKHGAREYDLTLDQGRSVVAGRASLTTIDQIEKAGGWPVTLALKAMVHGVSVDQFLLNLRDHHEANGARLSSILGLGRPVVPDRSPDRADDGHPLDQRRRAVGDRRTESQG